MINLNVCLEINSGYNAELKIVDPELNRMFDKWGGWVNVKISKPISKKTQAQINTAFALVTAFYLSGMASLPENCTLDKFRFIKKMDYGPCHEVEYKGKIVRFPKSMAEYSKDDFCKFIDSIIIEIVQAGASGDKKIAEILNGMKGEQ